MGNTTMYPMSVILTVRDAAKSVAYFRDKLGFQLEQSFPDASKPMWANLVMDGQSVMLGQMMDPSKASGDMCGNDLEAKAEWETLFKEMQGNKSGVGIQIYIAVKDIDAYHATITKNGVKASTPRNQFYGLRDTHVQDPDGFRFVFYTAIKMANCQSCGMPMKDAKPGAMYCEYCTDAKGNLKSWETVLEGTTVGYFMGMQKMPRDKAEAAAREHLSKMPAWHGRSKSGPEKVGSH